MSSVPKKRILITSGPTREYLDPVRFLSNDSSGKMGAALAQAALEKGFEVVLVSGPVSVEYPEKAELHFVRTTEEMLQRCLQLFPNCFAMIGAAAPCDYRPVQVSTEKLSKTTFHGSLELCETPDILAALGKMKRHDQKIIAFALEMADAYNRAVAKMRKKNADYIALNGPNAIHAEETEVTIIDANGNVHTTQTGSKIEVARSIIELL